ncbi:MAG TPA: hypothetical protein VHE35_33865 [Kofleriaceae bacterium]|nr:hypothetical protein [Kofleriaceae bacterium]
MLELLDAFEGGGRKALVAEVERHARAAVDARGKGHVGEVARVEAAVAADPARAITFDADGFATVTVPGARHGGGRFEAATIGTLRARAADLRARAGGERPAAGRRLWILDGMSPATDIGALQASAAPGSLFQAASQFNCLESPGAYVVPVAHYLHDPTQGPRAAISAFPGTMVRHYAAPAADGTRFVQRTDARQLDLLAGVCDATVAKVKNGYLRAPDVRDPAAFARALEDRFDAIAVGVHDRVDVVLGADWGGRVDGRRTIAQVYTSTMAGGGYGGLGDGDAGDTILRQLQRGAYLGTLLAAAALGCRRVCLTLIGGGVFANPMRTIWDAILWASDRIEPFLHRDLSIVVNGRNLRHELPAGELAAAAFERGGALLRFDRAGAAFVDA